MQGSDQAMVPLSIGISIGISIGVATDNIGLWLSVGLALGAAVAVSGGNTTENDEDTSTEEPTKD